MDVPTLPAIWLRDTQVKNEYDAWRDRALASGLSASEMNREFHKGGVRARLKKFYEVRQAFADEENNRGLLKDFSAELYAPVPEHKKRMLTIEVRVLGENLRLLRDPMLFVVQHFRMPDGLLLAGRGTGFGYGSREYFAFINLLYAEAQESGGGARRILSVVGNTSDFGASGVKSIALSVKNSAPVAADAPLVPMREKVVGLTSIGKLISHKFIKSKVEVLPDGDFAFVPSEELTEGLLNFFAENEKEDACAYDAIIGGFKESWDKHYKKPSMKLTHALIRRELGKNVGDGWKVKLTDLEVFFADENRKLSCVIIDLWGNVVWKRVWEEQAQNNHISPRTLYLLTHNEHVWRISTEAQSLANTGVRNAEVVDDADAVPTIDPPLPVYKVVPELDEKWELWKLCDSWADVKEQFLGLPDYVSEWEAAQTEKKKSAKKEEDDSEGESSHHKEQSPTLSIHYSGNMELLFKEFYKNKDYECEVVVRDEAIKELRLNLEAKVRILTFSVEGEPCLVRKPRELKDGDPIANEKEYQKFLPLFASAKTSFLHRDWMSHYSTGLMRAFQQYPRGQLVRNFVDGEPLGNGEFKEIEGVGVDICSFYASVLLGVEKLPVFSPMSDFRAFGTDMTLNEHCFYIVESRCDSVEGFIILNRKFNLVSGWTLLNCGLPNYKFKVRAYVRPVSLVNNEAFGMVVERVAEELGDPLTNTGKFILNSLIGLTGKRKAQNMNGKWTSDYEEARVRTANLKDIYAYADGFLSLARSEEVFLENGFFPAQFLVYDRARVALLRLFRQLKKSGCEVFGIKTDCFIVDKLPADFPLVDNGRLVKNMGHFHREPEPKFAAFKLFNVSQNDDNAPVWVNLTACREPIDCEVMEQFAGDGREFNFSQHPPICVYKDFSYRELTATHTFYGTELVVVEDGTLVLGACAGSGKTTCCSASCEGRTLVVVPTNKRVDEFETEWLNTIKFRAGELVSFQPKFSEKVSEVVVMTTAEFLGRRISEEGGEKKTKTSKMPELNDFNTIFIDEFFQSSSWDIIALTRRILKLREQQLPEKEKLRAYFQLLFSIGSKERLLTSGRGEVMLRESPELHAKMLAEVSEMRTTLGGMRAELFPSRTKLFANGDTFQLTNHESWNYIGDKQEFCDKFLWRVFPKRIFLRENFRLVDPNERPVLMSILADLKLGQHEDEETGDELEDTHQFVLRVLKKNGLGGQIFTDPDEVLRKGRNGEPIPCLAWSNVVGNAINQRFGGEEKVGMLVVCRSYMMRKYKNKEGKVEKRGLRMNKVYEVLKIKDGCYFIKQNAEDEGTFYPRIKFRRNIAQTAHAVQGETIAENFGIFEFGSNPDWRWLYVALSRASSLKQAWFYDGKPLLKRRELGVVIREKLASYKEQDEKAKRSTKDFISEKWVMERFKSQNYCCAEQECMRPMLLEWDAEDEEERGQQFSVDRTNNELGHVLRNCRLTCLRCNLAAASEGK